MNLKRTLIGIVVVFVAVFATDFLIHGVWLANTYKETMSLWRPDAEMQARFGWMLLAQFLWAMTFVVVWSKGFPATSTLCGATWYGTFMGIFFQANTLILYVVQPFPPSLAVKWFVSGVAQGALMGLVIFLVGRPKGQPLAGQPAA